MDGVLLTSTPAVERVWRQWATEHGFDPDHVARLSHGRRSIETLAELHIPAADLEAENIEVERREIADTDGVFALDGARELLVSLPRDRWAVVTSATRPLAEARLRISGFSVPGNLITAEMVARGKPNPEPYLRGAALLGFAPRDCIVVEDVPPGIAAAKAAGMRALALTTTVNASELISADWIANTCSDLRVSLQGDHLALAISEAAHD